MTPETGLAEIVWVERRVMVRVGILAGGRLWHGISEYAQRWLWRSVLGMLQGRQGVNAARELLSR